LQGVISVLDEITYNKVADLWAELEAEYGLRGARTAYPHFTYQVVESYDLEALEAVLAQVAHDSAVFQVSTSGIGIFTGERPVLYVPVVRSQTLNQFHRLLWEQITPLASGVHPHYQPRNWFPHVTLAIDDLTHDELPDIIRQLSRRNFSWNIAINNVCVVYNDPARKNSWTRYAFNGEKSLLPR